ncbi:MAG TPA: choice-of-anchor Q domain-containing protein [Kiritimatiellia bacterium]|nr:choice-of-anchor Q domain-containing protein [Kiritimatiellia bacterium]
MAASGFATMVPPVSLSIDPYERSVAEAPLVLQPRHSVDYRDMDGQICDEEILDTIALWQAGSYHFAPHTELGYAPGDGAQAGLPYSADYRTPQWSIDTHELNRQLAVWRAGAYRDDPLAEDGFTPVWHATYRLSEGPFTAVLFVDPASPSPAPPYLTLESAAHDLQAAIDAAPDGAVIRVASGIYHSGSINSTAGLTRIHIAKPITVESIEGPRATMIVGQAQPATRCVILEHPLAVFRGFTLSHGHTIGQSDSLANRSGGGLLGLAFREISDCIVQDSSALPWGSGGGMALINSSGTVTRVELNRNQAAYGGGAAIYWGNHTRINRLGFRKNHAVIRGGGLLADNAPSLASLLLVDNSAGVAGGGVALAHNSTLWHATIVGNHAPAAAGLLFDGHHSRVFNSILVENLGGDIGTAGTWTGLAVNHSCTPGQLHPSISTSNLVQIIPDFIHPGLLDFRIRNPDSPLVNAGFNAAWMDSATDLDGAPRRQGHAPDLGAYEQAIVEWNLTAPPSYIPGMPLEVNLHIAWPETLPLGAMSVHLDLPPHWSITNVSGHAQPTFLGEDLVFLGHPTGSTISATLLIATTTNTSPQPQITPRLDWQLFGMSQTLSKIGPGRTLQSAGSGSFVSLQATSSPHGSITPPYQVYEVGSHASVLVQADPYFLISQLLVNGDPVPDAANQTQYPIEFFDLRKNIAIHADFSPKTTLHGVPLHWLAYFGLTNIPPDQAALEDTDNDGMPNWKEYIAGTSPTDENDVFTLEVIAQPEATGNSSITLSWPSLEGRIYNVYASPCLIKPQWQPVATALPATPPLNSYQPTASDEEAYYRIEVLLAP